MITRKVTAQDNSPKIQELMLSKILHRTGIAITEDKEAKFLRLIPMDIPHMRMNVNVRKQANRVICNARKTTGFSYQRQRYLNLMTISKSHYADQICSRVLISQVTSIKSPVTSHSQ